jgi:hypothetical protein
VVAKEYESKIEEFKSLKEIVREKTQQFETGLTILRRDDLSAEEVLSIKSDLGVITDEINDIHKKLDEISQVIKESLRHENAK